MSEIDEFDAGLSEPHKAIVSTLRRIIEASLPQGQSKLFHGAPVWFIDGNPVAGYSIKKAGVALLFWSGQGFLSPGLKPVGKHKAAEAVYASEGSIDEAALRKWLAESVAVQWNYRDIVRNGGRLEALTNLQ